MPYSYNGVTVYYYGESELEKLTDLKSSYRQPQEYERILSENSGRVFSDPEFPHTDASIGNTDNLLDVADPGMANMVSGWRQQGWNGSATWIRVGDLCKKKFEGEYEACFNCGDIGTRSGRMDIQQGLTGDCWFLCSLSAVSMEKKLINNVIPSDNTTNDVGVYHFRFWYQGSWIDIPVDDYIPCFVVGTNYNIVGNNFFINNNKAEFWPMLVEKAFAKLNGSYSNIAANVCMYALESLTGGFGECVQFSDGVPEDQFQQILNWLGKDSVICVGSRDGASRGVIGNHAYSLTGATTLHVKDGYGNKSSVDIVRLRNPWGNTEWKGDWSDDSPLWKSVSKSQKDKIGLVNKDDGEFWISYKDLLSNYGDLSNCTYFDLSRLTLPTAQLRFQEFHDEWNISKGTAGGWGYPEKNPHYTVEVSTDHPGVPCVMVIGVLAQAKLYNEMGVGGGFCIRVFQAFDSTNYDTDFFRTHTEENAVGKDSVTATAMKSYSLGYAVAPGRYVIVPTSLEPNFEKKICIRIMSQKKAGT